MKLLYLQFDEGYVLVCDTRSYLCTLNILWVPDNQSLLVDLPLTVPFQLLLFAPLWRVHKWNHWRRKWRFYILLLKIVENYSVAKYLLQEATITPSFIPLNTHFTDFLFCWHLFTFQHYLGSLQNVPTVLFWRPQLPELITSGLTTQL